MKVTLVHSPLVGASCWNPVARVLDQHGVSAEIPSLTPFLDEPDFWTEAGASLQSVLGHHDAVVLYSASGLLAPAIPEGMPIVFVDAQLPREIETWWDGVPDDMRRHLSSLVVNGSLPPFPGWWEDGVIEGLLPDQDLREEFVLGCPPIPWTFTQAPLPPAGEWQSHPASFLRLSDGYEEQFLVAESLGWRTEVYDGHHLSLLASPSDVAALVLELFR